ADTDIGCNRIATVAPRGTIHQDWTRHPTEDFSGDDSTKAAGSATAAICGAYRRRRDAQRPFCGYRKDTNRNFYVDDTMLATATPSSSLDAGTARPPGYAGTTTAAALSTAGP